MSGGGQARANLEIKARCDDLDAARLRALALAARPAGVDRQLDTYFRTAAGRLKLRESRLEGAQLVPYLRPDVAGPRRADYRVIPVEDPGSLKRLLAAILGVHRVVEKQREILLLENVRIHLDRVAGLGDFLELEAVFDGRPASEPGERRRLERLMRQLGVRPEDLVDGSYETLVGEPGS
jgi:predicted adenylyl cyclase CyaB